VSKPITEITPEGRAKLQAAGWRRGDTIMGEERWMKLGDDNTRIYGDLSCSGNIATLAEAATLLGLTPMPLYTAEQVEEAVKLAVTVPSLVSLTIREQDVIKREFLRYLTRRDET
jgi:hypothetical protein